MNARLYSSLSFLLLWTPVLTLGCDSSSDVTEEETEEVRSANSKDESEDSQEPRDSMQTNCEGGKYGVNCLPCPAGLFCKGGSSKNEQCEPGQYCPEGTVTPQACPAGSYCETPATEPVKCEAGEYCAEGSTAPSECQAGEYCPEGSVEARVCAAGTWDDDGDASTECLAWSECVIGQEESSSPTTLQDRVCLDFSWTKQFGTDEEDYAFSITMDANHNIYVSGQTAGALNTEKSEGNKDAYVMKLNAGGELQWTRQFGTASRDYARSVTTDASGNVYVSGQTEGALENGESAGAFDAYVMKLNAAGEVQWTEQFGTLYYDEAYSVATDASGNVYVGGYAEGALGDEDYAGSFDAYVMKLNAAGKVQWTKQFGTTTNDQVESVTTDSLGNVIVSGFTQGVLDGDENAGNFDAYVMKLTSTGVVLWTEQFGTGENDFALSVTSDSNNNVYVSGSTLGALEAGESTGDSDAYVMKLSADGEVQWVQQFGVTKPNQIEFFDEDYSYSVITDASGNVYTSGFTEGDLEGNESLGGRDAYMMKLNAEGEIQWTKQFGSENSDWARSLTLDAAGHIYVGGYTTGDLGESENAGGRDVFVRRFLNSELE